MDDEFLHRLREAPDPAFADALYRRISQPERRPAMLTALHVSGRRLAWTAAALGALCMLLIAASPTARAGVLAALRQIGGIGYEEVDGQPPSTGAPVTTYTEQTVMLDEAAGQLPGPLPLPQWAPDGFTRSNAVTITPPQQGLTFTWARVAWRTERPQDTPIYFQAWYPATPDATLSWQIGKNAVEQVQINGQPAALVRGAFDADSGVYGAPDMLSLQWKRDGLYFTLNSSSTVVSVDELIRMAESMR